MSVPHGQDLWYHHLQYQSSICSLFIGVPDMVKHTLNDYGLLWHNSGLLWQAYMLPYCYMVKHYPLVLCLYKHIIRVICWFVPHAADFLWGSGA